MASRQNYFPSEIQHSNSSTDLHLEFHESDLIWNADADANANADADADADANADDRTPSSPVPQPPRPRKRSIPSKSGISPAICAPSSLPVNIPKWGEDHGGSDEEDEEDAMPPHEYAARQLARRNGMVVAHSLQEGVGRTLKGRDLRRVRNAIWKQTTGFQD